MDSNQFEVQIEQYELQSEQNELQSEQNELQTEQSEVNFKRHQLQSQNLGSELDVFDSGSQSTTSSTSGISGSDVGGMISDGFMYFFEKALNDEVARHKAENEAKYQQALVDLRNNSTHLVEQIQNQTLVIEKLRRHTFELKNALVANYNILANIWGDFARQVNETENRFMSVEAGLNIVLSRIERAKQEIVRFIHGVESEIIAAIDNEPKVEAIKHLNSTFNYIIASANVYRIYTIQEKVANFEGTSESNSIVRWEKARVPQPGESMYNSLWDIINRDWAIPANSKDDLSVGALQMLVYGMYVYVFILHYLMQQYSDLAQYYYGEGDLDKYNKYYLRSLNVYNAFSGTLIGEHGLFQKVASVLRQVKRLHFIRRDRLDVDKFVIKSLASLDKLRVSLRKLSGTMLVSAPDVLDPQLNFTESDIKANEPNIQKVLPWTRGSRVTYAIQLLGKNGQPNSMVSKWTANYTLTDWANPTVKVYHDPLGRTRVIFRRFNLAKPQVVAVLTDPDQVEFRDIARDLFDNIVQAHPKVSLKMVKFYLEHGADVNALLDGYQMALHAAAKRDDQLKVAAELIEHGADIDAQDVSGFTPLYIAAKYDNFAFVQKLIEHKANVTLASNENNHQLTPLHVAILKGNDRIVQMLLAVKSIDLNARSTEGFTPLHFAAAFNRVPVVSMLLADSRTDIDAKTSLRFAVPGYMKLKDNMDKVASVLASSANVTPLHLAFAYGSETVVSQLLAKGADIHARTTDGSTVMHYAALNDNDALIPDSAKLNNIVNSPNMRDFTPLYIAYQHSHKKVSQKLLDYGADINVRLSNQRTMLHIAVQCEDANVVNKLLDNSVAVDATDAEGYQALHYAVWLNSPEMVDLLLSRDASPNVVHSTTRQPLVHSALNLNQYDAYDMIEKFVQKKEFNVNIADIGSNTLLHLAAVLNYDKLAELLSNHTKIEIDAPNDNNLTPLHVALEKGNVEVAYRLIKKGANLTAYGEGEWRAVNYAIAGPLNGIQTASFVENVYNVTNECAMIENYIEPLDPHVLLEINILQASEYGKFEVIEFYGKNCEWLKRVLNDGEGSKFTRKIDFDYIRKICGHGYANVLKYLYPIRGTWNVLGYDMHQIPVLDALRGNTNIEVIRYLHTQDYRIRPDINLILKDFPDNTNWNALNYTIMGKGDRDVIEFISEKSTFMDNPHTGHEIEVEILFPELRGDNGETLMHLAAMSGKIEIAEFLLEKKVDINTVDKDEYSPLHYAARTGNLDMVIFMVEKGAEVDKESKDKTTPLIEAVWHEHGNLELVQYLYWKKARILLNAPWLLVLRAAQLNKASVAVYLCEIISESDCVMPDSDNVSPLHYAAMHNNILLAQFFMDHSAYVESETNDKLTPLHYAIEHAGQLEIVKYLHSKRNNKNKFTLDNLINLAIGRGKYDIASYLIDAGYDFLSPNGQNKSTPLHEAVNANRIDLIQQLISNGADITVEDSNGKTPIDWIFMNRKDTALQYFMFFYEDETTGGSLMHQRTLVDDAAGVRWLVERGRDVNSPDKQRNTPLHLAAEKGFIQVARELLKSKCVNLSSKNADGKTAFDVAKENGHDDIAKLIDNKNMRRRRDVAAQAEESVIVQSVASSAGRPIGLINHAIGSLVRTFKSLPGQLASLMPFSNSNGHSAQSAFPSVHSTDLNSTLLLLDVIVRKYSGERYVDTSLSQSITPEEARLYALELVEQLHTELDQLAQQSDEGEFEFDLFQFYQSVEKLVLSGQYDQIERLMHSTAREAFPHSKIEHSLIAKRVERVWSQICPRKQNSELNFAAVHSFSDCNFDQTAQNAQLGRVLVSKQSLI